MTELLSHHHTAARMLTEIQKLRLSMPSSETEALAGLAELLTEAVGLTAEKPEPIPTIYRPVFEAVSHALETQRSSPDE